MMNMKMDAMISLGCLLATTSLSAGWTEPVQISNDPNATVQGDVFPAPGGGTLAAIWVNNSGSFPYAAVSTNGGLSWGPDVRVNATSSNSGDAYIVYDSAHAKFVAAWVWNTSPFNIITDQSSDGVHWNPIVTVPAPGDHGFVSEVYDSGNQSLLAFFQKTPAPNPEPPYVSISTDGGTTWSTPADLTGSSTVYDETFIFGSYDAALGRLVAAWPANPSQFPTAIISDDHGSSWNSLVTISNDPISDNVFTTYNPVYGTTVATWADENTGVPMFAISLDGGKTWGAAGQLTGNTYDVRTASNPVNGTMILVFADSNTGLGSYAFSSDGGQTWSSVAPINTTIGATTVNAAYDPVSQSFVAVWSSGVFPSIFPYAASFSLYVPLSGLSGNIQRLANYINSSTSPSILQIAFDLSQLSPSALKAALIAMLPKPSAKISAANTAFSIGDAVEHDFREQTRRRREKNKDIALIYTESESLIAQADGLPRGSAQTAARQKENYSVWADGLGQFTQQKGQDQLPAFHTSTWGVIVGMDYYGTHCQVTGIFSYANSHVNGHLDRNKVDTYALGVYGIGYIGDAYIETGILGVRNQYEQNRHVVFPGFDEHAKSKHHGWQTAPHLGFGYDIAWGRRVLEPFADADCAVVFESGFSEHGSAPIDYKQKSSTSELLRAKAGLNVYIWEKYDWGLLFFRGTLAYMYKKGFGIGNIENVAFIGEPPGFSVFAYNTAQNLFAPGVEILGRFKHGIFGSVTYDGQFASRYMSNSVLAKIGVYF